MRNGRERRRAQLNDHYSELARRARTFSTISLTMIGRIGGIISSWSIVVLSFAATVASLWHGSVSVEQYSDVHRVKVRKQCGARHWQQCEIFRKPKKISRDRTRKVERYYPPLHDWTTCNVWGDSMELTRRKCNRGHAISRNRMKENLSIDNWNDRQACIRYLTNNHRVQHKTETLLLCLTSKSENRPRTQVSGS